MNLVTRLHELARERPGQPALVAGGGRRERAISFAALSRRVAKVAGGLRARGLEPGDRLIAFHPIAIELYELLLGAFHAGITVVLADPAGGADFLRQVVRRVRPRAFFGSRKAQLLRLRHRELGRIPVAFHPRGWCPGSCAPDGATVDVFEAGADHPALVTFTSGSTGRPKGVVRSHGFLLAQHRSLERTLKLEAGDCDLVTLPVFALANLASGVTSVIADIDLRRVGEARGEPIRHQCARWNVNRATASPAFFEALLADGGLPPFARIFSGGAPVFADLMDRLVAALPGVEVTAVYGSTEAEPVAEFSHAELDENLRAEIRGGGGLPAGNAVLDVAILRDCSGSPLRAEDEAAFDALRVAPGEVGEIVVAGPQVLTGYLDGEGDELTKIRVAGRTWHRTGDAGRVDAGGRLWLLGRCAARMRRAAGEVIYPFAIEAALRESFPRLRTAALEWEGEVLVVVEPGAPGELAGMARQVGCGRVVELDKIPLDRRHQAKVDYPALRKAVGEAVASD